MGTFTVNDSKQFIEGCDEEVLNLTEINYHNANYTRE